MDTIRLALEALIGAGTPLALISAATAIISSIIWLLRRPKLKAHGSANVTILGPASSKEHAHGHEHDDGHGRSEDDPDEWFRSHITNEVREISAKLDVITTLAALDVGKAVHRTRFWPYVLGNVVWSLFGGFVGLVLPTLPIVIGSINWLRGVFAG